MRQELIFFKSINQFCASFEAVHRDAASDEKIEWESTVEWADVTYDVAEDTNVSHVQEVATCRTPSPPRVLPRPRTNLVGTVEKNTTQKRVMPCWRLLLSRLREAVTLSKGVQVSEEAGCREKIEHRDSVCFCGDH